ncbi:MAG: hypothetical protein WBX02_07200 [Terriglobales bacterium]
MKSLPNPMPPAKTKFKSLYGSVIVYTPHLDGCALAPVALGLEIPQLGIAFVEQVEIELPLILFAAHKEPPVISLPLKAKGRRPRGAAFTFKRIPSLKIH